MRIPFSLLLFSVAICFASQTAAQKPSPSHVQLAKTVVAKFEDTRAWIEYFEFRFSQKYPEAPEAFYVSIRPELSKLGKVYDDSLAGLYTKLVSEKELLSCLRYLEGTTGTRYRQFLTVGIREHFDAGKTERLAPKLVKKYRNTFLLDSNATGYIPGALSQDRFWQFASYFSDAPIAQELKNSMISKFDTVPPQTWISASRELKDSVVAQIARIAPDYLSEKEIRSLDSMFATKSGKLLDPRVHRNWFGKIEDRHYKKFQDTYIKRWKRYEYVSFRYPPINELVDYRGLKFSILHRNETAEGELNWKYEGVGWIVEVSGFSGKAHDFTVMSRWLADYRFMYDGNHKIYFVKKKFKMDPVDPLQGKTFSEYLKSLDAKLRKKFVGVEIISKDDVREMIKYPL